MKFFKGILLLIFVFLLSACSNFEKFASPIAIVSTTENVCCVESIKADTLFVVAMPSEAKYVIEKYNLKEFDNRIFANGKVACVVTGIGGENVIDTFKNIAVSDSVRIINVGYCGSNVIKKGEVCEVRCVAKNEDPLKQIKISSKGVPCYTADHFVLKTNIKEPCVFDMELFYFRQLFPKLISYKIVSDNLSHDEYEEFKDFNGDKSWERFFILSGLEN